MEIYINVITQYVHLYVLLKICLCCCRWLTIACLLPWLCRLVLYEYIKFCVTFYIFFLHVYVCLKPFLTSVIHYVILLFNITLLVPWNLLELVLEHHTTCPQRSVRINPTTIKRELLAFGLKVSVKSYGFFLIVLCNFLFFTCEMRIAVTASDHFSVS